MTNPDKIYIKEIIPITCLRDVIDCLYMRYDGTRGMYANTTFFDKECTMVECRGQRRSFEDLLTLARTYFPGIMETELMATLKDLHMICIYCPDIRKIVFLYAEHMYLGVDTFKSLEIKRSYQADTYTAEDLISIYNQL